MPSKIEWLDGGDTWNPLGGCDPVSPGCAHCYAATMAKRLQAMGVPMYQGTVDNHGRWTGVVNLGDERALTKPLRWRKPRTIFVNSMSDLFHDAVPDEFIDKVFAVMALCPQHTFIVLTKRAERMHDYMKSAYIEGWTQDSPPLGEDTRQEDRYPTYDRIYNIAKHAAAPPWKIRSHWPLPNVIGMVSVENQEAAYKRIPLLLDTPFAMRGISAEPLLGEVDLGHFLCKTWRRGYTLGRYLDWVIVGGESGPDARYMDPEWARSLRDQCKDVGVAFFMKQMSGKAPIPDDLMVREWPATEVRNG